MCRPEEWRVVPVRAGGDSRPLVDVLRAGLDVGLRDAADAVLVVGEDHPVPVGGGRERELVVTRSGPGRPRSTRRTGPGTMPLNA